MRLIKARSVKTLKSSRANLMTLLWSISFNTLSRTVMHQPRTVSYGNFSIVIVMYLQSFQSSSSFDILGTMIRRSSNAYNATLTSIIWSTKANEESMISCKSTSWTSLSEFLTMKENHNKSIYFLLPISEKRMND